MRRIEIHLKGGDSFESVIRAVKHFDTIDYSIIHTKPGDRRLVSILMREGNSQELIDAIHSTLEGQRDWRLSVIAIEASLPKAESTDGEKDARNTQAIREEILQDIGKGAVFDRDFAIFVGLSTVVAAVGMNSGSVAGVIGAMVIAPLLGPILAFAMGAALGDSALLRQSGRTLISGIMIALLCGLLLSFIVPVDLSSTELTSRAEVRLDAVALALAAGAAAALSVAKGQGAGLVGVMVAAALLPPGAAMGLLVGSGELELGARAGLLLALNVACLILAALLTFRLRKIQPRQWIEQKNANAAVAINTAFWVACLIIVGALILYFDLGARVEFP